jgi:hypothetical protein
MEKSFFLAAEVGHSKNICGGGGKFPKPTPEWTWMDLMTIFVLQPLAENEHEFFLYSLGILWWGRGPDSYVWGQNKKPVYQTLSLNWIRKGSQISNSQWFLLFDFNVFKTRPINTWEHLLRVRLKGWLEVSHSNLGKWPTQRGHSLPPEPPI